MSPLQLSEAAAPPILGGKGASLRRLVAAGFPVPGFAVLGADVLDDALARSGVGPQIEQDLEGVSTDSAGEVAARIEQRIRGIELWPELRAAIAAAHAEAGGGLVAVRSSAVDEDGEDHSFAGQGSSYLGIDGDDAVAEHVLRCWASTWSERALTYRLLHALPLARIRAAVVLQEMVRADVSGVLFTLDPSTGSTDDLVISAVYGLGESLVSGTVDADTITVGRADGRVRSTVVGGKELRLDVAPNGQGLREEREPATRRDALALSEAAVEELRTMGLAIEQALGAPQDIEFAYAGEQLWILQARPITQAPAPPVGALRLWDNANIVENFGDVTAPLTFSFANHVYGSVYLDYCRVLGVPRKRLPMMLPYTRNLLGSFDGRVYYNVLNWYMVLALVPASSIQRKVLAATAGVAEASPELGDAQRPFAPLGRRAERRIHRRTARVFLRRFFTAQRTTRHFLTEFDAVYARFDRDEVERLRAAEAWAAYEALEAELLSKWGPTAVLDAVISLSLGVLYGLTTKWLPDAPDWFLLQAIRVDDAALQSALPADRLTAMAASVRDDAALAALVGGVEPEALPAALAASGLPGAPGLLAEFDRYLEAFGDRAINELKLEQPDLRDEPALAWSMLRDAVIRPVKVPAPGPTHDPDAWLEGRLGGLRGWIYGKVRRKVQNALRARESVRFARSQAFAMVRRLLRAVGDDLARESVLAHPSDVFFLKLEELRGLFAGTVDRGELQPLAELRRRRQEEQRRLPGPPPRFFTRGLGEPEPDHTGQDATQDGASGVLRGRASCPGVVIGEARVVDEPRDVAGHVLVTYRTDPGWVGALSSASALVIERGSPLTHVAVVARELGIPTVVQVPGLTNVVTSGMRIRVDGGAGTVELLDQAATADRGSPEPDESEVPA